MVIQIALFSLAERKRGSTTPLIGAAVGSMRCFMGVGSAFCVIYAVFNV